MIGTTLTPPQHARECHRLERLIAESPVLFGADTRFVLLPPVWPLSGNEVALADDMLVLVEGRLRRIRGGFRYNGASIPNWPLLQWLTGHPLTGEYVHASAVHDEDCVLRREPHTLVHRRFLLLLRAHVRSLPTLATPGTVRAQWERSVRRTRIELMGLAVKWFGPTWTLSTPDGAHVA